MTTDEHIETVIIGGGQAGLAVGYHLTVAGARIRDPRRRTSALATRGESAGPRFGCTRRRSFDGLPGMRFPGTRPLVSDWSRDGRLPGVLRRAVRAAGPVGSPPLTASSRNGDGYVVTAGALSLRRGERGRRDGCVPARAPDRPRVRGRARSLDSPAPLGRLPRPRAAAAGAGARRRRRALGRRHRLRGRARGAPDRPLRKGHRPDTGRHSRAGGCASAWPVLRFLWTRVLTVATPLGRKAKARGSLGRRPAAPGQARRSRGRGVERVHERTVGVAERETAARRRSRASTSRTSSGARASATTRAGSGCRSRERTDGYPDQKSTAPFDSLPGLYFVGLPFLHSFAPCWSLAPAATRSASPATSSRACRRTSRGPGSRRRPRRLRADGPRAAIGARYRAPMRQSDGHLAAARSGRAAPSARAVAGTGRAAGGARDHDLAALARDARPSASSRTSARRTRARRTRRSRSSQRQRRGRLCGPAAHARAGGAPAAGRPDRRRERRADHGRGARERARPGHLLARSRWRRHSGELLVLDEVQWADDTERGSAWTRLAARRGVPRDPPARRARRAPARRARVPGRRAQGLRAQAAARVRRRADAPLADDGDGRRRVQPQGRPRARRRGEPAASRPRRRALRRDAARLAAGGDRPLPLGRRRTSASRPTCSGTASTFPCETLLFAETTKFDGEERRDLHPVGARADRGPGRALRARRARPRRRPRRARLGSRRTRSSSSRSARAARPAPWRHPRLPRRRRGADPATALRPRRRRSAAQLGRGARRVAPRRAPGVGLRELARRRVAAAAPRSASRRCSGASPSAAGASRSRTRGSSSTPRSTRTASSCSAPSRSRSRAIASPARTSTSSSTRPASAAPRSRTRSRPGARRASCAGSRSSTRASGGVTIERAAALEEAAAERVVARLRVEVESPTIGRCRSCGRSCAPWFPLCDRCAGHRRAVVI